MVRKLLIAGVALVGLASTASAAVVQYTSFADFTGSTTISESGDAINTTTAFTSNSRYGFSGGDAGAASGEPLTISAVSAYEVGMIFGNDQGTCCGSNGFFDVTLEGFAGAASVGSVTVATNGNDLNDQFIGFGSDTLFDRVVLSYGAGRGGLAHFITQVRFGDGQQVIGADVVPLPASAVLLLGGLGGLAAMRRRRKS